MHFMMDLRPRREVWVLAVEQAVETGLLHLAKEIVRFWAAVLAPFPRGREGKGKLSEAPGVANAR